MESGRLTRSGSGNRQQRRKNNQHTGEGRRDMWKQSSISTRSVSSILKEKRSHNQGPGKKRFVKQKKRGSLESVRVRD